MTASQERNAPSGRCRCIAMTCNLGTWTRGGGDDDGLFYWGQLIRRKYAGYWTMPMPWRCSSGSLDFWISARGGGWQWSYTQQLGRGRDRADELTAASLHVHVHGVCYLPRCELQCLTATVGRPLAEPGTRGGPCLAASP